MSEEGRNSWARNPVKRTPAMLSVKAIEKKAIAAIYLHHGPAP